MRRAALRVFRTTLHSTIYGFRASSLRIPPFSLPLILPSAKLLASARVNTIRPRGMQPFSTSASVQIINPIFPLRKRPGDPASSSMPVPEPLQSSMYVRRASVALVSALVGYGAWQYSYKGNDTEDVVSRKYSTATSLDVMPTRQVLVIGQDELQLGTWVGEGPISKTTDDAGRKVLEMLTPEQATQRLRTNEESYLVNRGQGVVRYDIVQIPSNDPIEDDHDKKIIEISGKGTPAENSDWMFWGVFDGHSGWVTSAKLRQSLIRYVAGELNDTFRSVPTPSSNAIEAAIKTGFTRLDDEIVHKSVARVLESNNKTVAAELLAPALSGSCALLSFYDSRSKLLRVACTGDSRAVLGRRSSSDTTKWTATPLSVDQTGNNLKEAERIRKEHPGEESIVIRNGRVLGGLEPTRAFGDAIYKWSKDVAQRLAQDFFMRPMNRPVRTPPYVTAEPVVTTTRIEPEKGDFLVLATDGLWEMLTNEEVVGLVGKWIESQGVITGPFNGGPLKQQITLPQLDSARTRLFGAKGVSTQGGLPVESSRSEKEKGQKAPRESREKDWFIIKDKNVATHLVRNALGGRNEEQVSALLTLPAPISRRYRDDLTVQVIFFGDGENNGGQVVLNLEATAKNSQPLMAKF